MKHLYSLLSKKVVFLFLFSFALAIQAQAQVEICDDGIDNDGDNFIDYYDPDCACTNVNYFGWCTPQCLYTEGFTAFSMEEQWRTTDVVPAYNTPIVADLDQDGLPEVIMMGMTGFQDGDPRRTSGIRIINGSTGVTKTFFTSVYMAWVSPHPIAVADVDGDGDGEIIVAALDHTDNAAGDRGRLVCYNRDGTRMWTSSAQFGANASRRYGSALGIADFNADGIPEVYCYNEIFNARTGVKLLTAGAPYTAARAALNDNGWGHMASPAAADLTSDPGLELACGNVVFNINITNTAGTAGNTMTGVPIVTVPAGTVVSDYDDGFTAISDIDSDGQLDVVVTTASSGGNNRALYVWNPRTQSIIAGTTDNAGGNSGVPFIGDIDNDKKPEIGITRSLKVMAYEYVGTTTLSKKWQLTTTDGSGFTGITMFDFNQKWCTETKVTCASWTVAALLW